MKNKTYAEYLAEKLDKNIDYVEYLAENLDKNIDYVEYVAEKLYSSEITANSILNKCKKLNRKEIFELYLKLNKDKKLWESKKN